MKKIMLAGFLTIYTLSGLAYAQQAPAKTETPGVKAEIEVLISKAEVSQKDPLKLNDAINKILDYGLYNKSASQATKSDVAARLVKIYNSLDDTLINTANKKQIIEFLGSRNKVPEAHEFFLSVLENGKGQYRAEALRAIYFGGIPGDDIYDKVKSLVARGIIKEEESLGSLKGANPQRALPEIQKFLATTKDPEWFVGIGHLLYYYKDPSLLDVLFQRYDYFKGLPASAWPEGYDPTLCISTEMLMKYIEVNEGVKLKKALEVFEDSGVFGNRKLPVLQKKLESANLATRKAATEFLIHQTEIGSVSRENIAPVLKDAEARETDKDLKLRLKSALKKLGPRVGGKK
ncbi:MAG: hypothetical protein A2X38_01955 [Elusimicrobia bacterium GWC2_61_25]|nr:MAG: hypothetical protein A2X38_01955 [Elusimicrobia bacterium GWC2_61_25]